MRKTASPGTRRTPHSSHRHWAPPYWTNARPPPREPITAEQRRPRRRLTKNISREIASKLNTGMSFSWSASTLKPVSAMLFTPTLLSSCNWPIYVGQRLSDLEGIVLLDSHLRIKRKTIFWLPNLVVREGKLEYKWFFLTLPVHYLLSASREPFVR